jgi:hypothetical protein
MAAKGSATRFEDLIELPDGRPLVTLQDAGTYITTKLSKAELKTPKWQTAIEILIGAAEGRDFVMHARGGPTMSVDRIGAYRKSPVEGQSDAIGPTRHIGCFEHTLALQLQVQCYKLALTMSIGFIKDGLKLVSRCHP